MPLTSSDALDFLRWSRGAGVCPIPPMEVEVRRPEGAQVSEVDRDPS
jgi:hypothetical protein